MLAVCDSIEAALGGGLAHVPADLPTGSVLSPGTALVVATSGSTGRPKYVELSREAVLASAAGSAAAVGGSGAWLLGLPVDGMAGLNVVLRSIVAGYRPVAMGPGRYTSEAFLAAYAQLPAGVPAYLSVVPTQLRRLLDESDPLSRQCAEALAGLATVLIGGAMVDAGLMERARAQGVTIVQTYGMAETCGGCVYDGRPLPGVSVAVSGDDGRVELAGPVLASGYVGDGDKTDDDFIVRDGTRWFRAHDLGEFDHQNRLRILGRSDDVIISGGVNIVPQRVEAVIRELPQVRDALVVPVLDAQWGQRAVALVIPSSEENSETLAEIVRAHVAQQLRPDHAPRGLLVVERFPQLPSGKVDRVTAAALAQAGQTYSSTL